MAKAKKKKLTKAQRRVISLRNLRRAHKSRFKVKRVGRVRHKTKGRGKARLVKRKVYTVSEKARRARARKKPVRRARRSATKRTVLIRRRSPKRATLRIGKKKYVCKPRRRARRSSTDESYDYRHDLPEGYERPKRKRRKGKRKARRNPLPNPVGRRKSKRSRSAAAKKAARTRKRNKAMHRAAGRKAARTRKRKGGTRKSARRVSRKGKTRTAAGRFKKGHKKIRRSARLRNPLPNPMRRRRGHSRRRNPFPNPLPNPMTGPLEFFEALFGVGFGYVVASAADRFAATHALTNTSGVLTDAPGAGQIYDSESPALPIWSTWQRMAAAGGAIAVPLVLTPMIPGMKLIALGALVRTAGKMLEDAIATFGNQSTELQPVVQQLYGPEVAAAARLAQATSQLPSASAATFAGFPRNRMVGAQPRALGMGDCSPPVAAIMSDPVATQNAFMNASGAISMSPFAANCGGCGGCSQCTSSPISSGSTAVPMPPVPPPPPPPPPVQQPPSGGGGGSGNGGSVFVPPPLFIPTPSSNGNGNGSGVFTPAPNGTPGIAPPGGGPGNVGPQPMPTPVGPSLPLTFVPR